MPRLYLQQGLSDRVVNAVVRRLERVLNMSSGAGDRVDAVVEETRTRSLSPRGGTGAEGTAPAMAPDGTGDAVPELGLPMPDGGTAVPDPALPPPRSRDPVGVRETDRTVGPMPQETTKCLFRVISCSRRVLRCS